jgi:hypothetical protein
MPPYTIIHANEHHTIALFESVTFCLWKTKTALLGIEKCCESDKRASWPGARPRNS